MPNNNPLSFKFNGRLVFIQEFLKHPLQIGSIIPSSRFLERRIAEAAGVASAKVIIELGPGIGGITREMLREMPRHAKLLSVEINPHFNKLVSRIGDDRLITHLGSASELGKIVSDYELDPPDAIVSGIPFSTMSRNLGSKILKEISSLLPPNGRFVAYQVNSHVASLCQPYLGTAQTSKEFFNIPPMRIFQWVKSA
ncbi:MAG: methyltransferase type 12 [Desulforhopalus sp.]